MTMEVLADWVSKVSNVVWNGLLLYLLVGTGIVFTIRTRFVQVRKFGAGWKHLPFASRAAISRSTVRRRARTA